VDGDKAWFVTLRKSILMVVPTRGKMKRPGTQTPLDFNVRPPYVCNATKGSMTRVNRFHDAQICTLKPTPMTRKLRTAHFGKRFGVGRALWRTLQRTLYLNDASEMLPSCLSRTNASATARTAGTRSSWASHSLSRPLLGTSSLCTLVRNKKDHSPAPCMMRDSSSSRSHQTSWHIIIIISYTCSRGMKQGMLLLWMLLIHSFLRLERKNRLRVLHLGSAEDL
jgi:hypothetical protein